MPKIRTLKKLFSNYLHQFNFLDACRFIFIDLISYLCDHNLVKSYSQTGEDRIVNSIIDIYSKWENADFSSKYYVEVGCNEPIKYSNTFGLYKQGWQGICIDANESLIKKFKKLRLRDVCISAVVSNQEKELTFTKFKDSEISSVNKDHVSEWSKYSQVISSETVKPIPLNKVLDEYQAPKSFALLCIDVERHDFEVLNSIDLKIYIPTLIVIETSGYNLESVNSSAIYQHICKHNYKLIAFALGNAYFLKTYS